MTSLLTDAGLEQLSALLSSLGIGLLIGLEREQIGRAHV